MDNGETSTQTPSTSAGGESTEGIVTETEGREKKDGPVYEKEVDSKKKKHTDLLDRMGRAERSIWDKGGFKRIKHTEK